MPGLRSDATLLAFEVRCSTSPSPTAVEDARQLFMDATRIMRSCGGVTEPIAGHGMLGYWDDRQDGVEHAARAACAISARGKGLQAANGPRIFPGPLELGIAVVSVDSSSSTGERAFHLASLARPGRALVASEAYEQVVELFDFQGVQPVVPRAERLEPVFELLGPKPERSGTHHSGPEKLPLVGRQELLGVLDECRIDVAAGKSLVVHLIGEPGHGKSKLIREWLLKCNGTQRLAAWTQLTCNGVPYGDYRMRSWSQLVAPLMQSTRKSPPQIPDVQTICKKLCSERRPVLIIADDLHWVDADSQGRIAQLISRVKLVLAIFAYRPSLNPKTLLELPVRQRRLRLAPLSDDEIRELTEMAAGKRGKQLSSHSVSVIAAKAHGSPLYVEEAVAHLANVGAESIDSLPGSLLELLIVRTEWAAQELVSIRRCGFICDEWQRRALLPKLELLEEQLGAWLDRFDVIEEESAPAVTRFLEGLRHVDRRIGDLDYCFGEPEAAPKPPGAGTLASRGLRSTGE